MWRLLLVWTLLRPGSAQDPGSWWSSAVYYNVLVDSYKDSDGDGLGDLIGVTKQLSYIRALGADAVILSPIISKNPDCTHPGILDHSALESRYGTLADLAALLEKAKKLELKVLVSLPLQTVSEASEWFSASANRSNGFDDWMLWRNGEADQTLSLEPGVESWTWHEDRSSYYASTNNESVLNSCSQGVIAHLAAAQCAWLRRGFSGVVLSPDFLPDQGCAEKLVKKMAADAIGCARTGNLETPVILVETSQKPDISTRYMSDAGVGSNSVISIPFASSEKPTAADVAMAVLGALTYAPVDSMPTWVTSSHGESHTATHYGSDMVDAINLLTMVFPGAAIIRQGDELGAVDTVLEWAATDKCWPSRILSSSAPFSWDASTNAGFSAGEPWLPLAPNYKYANAKLQFNNEGSHAGLVRIAAAMRKSPAMGPHSEIKRLGEAVAVLRWGGQGSLLVVANLGRSQTEVQLSRIPGLPLEMTVAISSGGSSLSSGSHINVDKTLKLVVGEAVLLAGPPRHCGGPGPVDKITNRLAEGWQKLNKYFNN